MGCNLTRCAACTTRRVKLSLYGKIRPPREFAEVYSCMDCGLLCCGSCIADAARLHSAASLVGPAQRSMGLPQPLLWSVV